MMPKCFVINQDTVLHNTSGVVRHRPAKSPRSDLSSATCQPSETHHPCKLSALLCPTNLLVFVAAVVTLLSVGANKILFDIPEELRYNPWTRTLKNPRDEAPVVLTAGPFAETRCTSHYLSKFYGA